MHQNEANPNGLTTPQVRTMIVHVSLDSPTVNFDESLQEKIDVKWCKEHVRWIARMITDQYFNEEESKLSNLMDTKGKVKNLKTGLKVQVCFQHHHGKLLSKWKESDKKKTRQNNVTVRKQRKLRKKYVVDR